MSELANRPNVGSAVFMRHAIKSLIFALFCSAMAFALAACGESGDDEGSCVKNPKSVPSRLTGELVLIYAGNPIDVPVTITTRPAAEDACKLDMIIAQNFHELCGEAFRGSLTFNADEQRWEGEMIEYDRKTELYNEDGTHMEVHYTEWTDGFYVWNRMHSSPTELCNGRVIEGDVAEDL